MNIFCPMELNPQQQNAVEHMGNHVLVLAGAGTGKTRTIIARAAFLIKSGVEPGRILLLTFTRRAAAEMVHRLNTEVGPDASRILGGTFHHFCLYTMRRMSKLFSIEEAIIIDRDDQLQLMRLARAGFRKKGEIFPQARELVDRLSYSRNTNQSLKDYLEKYTEYDEETIEKFQLCARDYYSRKKRSSYMDYDDILFHFARKLHEIPGIREKLRSFYDHILVDEMQDTNPLQWLILEGLRDPAVLFCVGDDAQSIYGFRGADFRNVHSFTDRVPGSIVLKLEKNYRSTQEILDLANWLLGNSPLNYGRQLVAHRGTGFTPLFIDTEDDFEEAGWITDDLIERHENGADWKAHMIITRTAYAARALEAKLIEKNIPYRFIGGTRLLQAAHVKDLLCMVRAAATHRDELAWIRYLTLWPGIGDVTAARCIELMKKENSPVKAIEALRNRFADRTEIIRGIDIVVEHWEKPATVFREAGLFLNDVLKNRYNNWKSRKKDFELLAKLAARYKSIISFLETYALESVSTTEVVRMDQDDEVLLITAHSAKGTEAPVCYLIKVEPGMYPHVRSIGITDEEEEERRVLYVAMTRAQNELIITRASTRFGRRVLYGGATGRHSRDGTCYFLNDIPEDLINTDITGFEPDSMSDYEVIKPWNRS